MTSLQPKQEDTFLHKTEHTEHSSVAENDDLILLPMEQARKMTYPPGCLVLCNKNFMGTVKSIYIDLSSPSRSCVYQVVATTNNKSLFVPEAQVQWAPSCPVWASFVNSQEQTWKKCVVLSSYQQSKESEPLYTLREERSGCLFYGIPNNCIRFRPVESSSAPSWTLSDGHTIVEHYSWHPAPNSSDPPASKHALDSTSPKVTVLPPEGTSHGMELTIPEWYNTCKLQDFIGNGRLILVKENLCRITLNGPVVRVETDNYDSLQMACQYVSDLLVNFGTPQDEDRLDGVIQNGWKERAAAATQSDQSHDIMEDSSNAASNNIVVPSPPPATAPTVETLSVNSVGVHQVLLSPDYATANSKRSTIIPDLERPCKRAKSSASESENMLFAVNQEPLNVQQQHHYHQKDSRPSWPKPGQVSDVEGRRHQAFTCKFNIPEIVFQKDLVIGFDKQSTSKISHETGCDMSLVIQGPKMHFKLTGTCQEIEAASDCIEHSLIHAIHRSNKERGLYLLGRYNGHRQGCGKLVHQVELNSNGRKRWMYCDRLPQNFHCISSTVLGIHGSNKKRIMQQTGCNVYFNTEADTPYYYIYGDTTENVNACLHEIRESIKYAWERMNAQMG